ncbi:MAG: SpoIIE family protein phosphatase [Candidatus Poribacteria bacterium]|nr:SpoIIE family protein phosphatase [Candidatus Poribacteria bacterium]
MNLLRKIVSILILSLCFGIAEHAAAYEQMQTYTVADGLVGPIVPVIFQDSRGVLWFGSDRGGVSHFDGNTFVRNTGDPEAFHGRTENIVEDKWGHIWFLSKHPAEGTGVISRYNGTTFEYEKIGDGTCLAVDNEGDIWVGGNNTVTRYTAINSQAPLQPYSLNIAGASVAKVNVIFQSRDGTIWVGGNDAQGALIMRFQGDVNVWQTATLQRLDNLPKLPIDRAVQVIAQDTDDNIWFGGESLLLRYNGTQFEDILKSDQTLSNLKNKKASVKTDRRGRIWFNDSKQLRWWDGKDLRRLRNLTQGASQDFLYGAFEIEDAWDKLWFATETGAHLYEDKYFQDEAAGVFKLESALTNSPESVHKVYGVDDELGSDNIQTIFEAMDGKIWFGHDNGVTVYEPQPAIVNHTTRAILGSNSIRAMYSDSAGMLWQSIPGGVARYDAKTDTLNQIPLTNFAGQIGSLKIEITFDDRELNRRPEIIKIFEADGDIWFLDKPIQLQDGFSLFRIFRYRNGEFEKLSLYISAEIGPGGEKIYNDSILVSSEVEPWIVLGGWLFLPRSDGLYRFLPNGESKILPFNRANFNKTDSFESLPSPTDAVLALHTDSQDRLWCYFETGEVRRFTNLSSRTSQPRIEVLPFKSVIPVLDITEAKDVKWFYNTVSGQLMYWENPDLANTLTELPGAASGAPLLSVQTSTVSTEPQNDDSAEDAQKSSELITFVFKDSIKTYQGTELKHDVPVELDEIRAALTATNGNLWLATSQGAIRYNGDEVTTYTTAEKKFLVDDLRDVHEDHWGNLWFATWGGGVVRYDGDTFQSITTKDGLIHNNVSSIHASNEEELWFGTEGGATQYRASLGALPFCRIVSVDAGKSFTEPFMAESGKRTFTEIDELLPAGLKNLTIHFQGISPLRDDVEYKFKLLGVDNNRWTTVSSDKMQANQTTYQTTFKDNVKQFFEQGVLSPDVGTVKRMPRIRYEDLKSGSYTFLIKAFREGWPYTQRPAVLNFTIDQPVWTEWRNYLPSLILLAAAGSLLFRLIVNRRQTAQLRLEMREKEEAEMQRIRAELDEAQNIQMALLPPESPETQDFDIAGMSIPATQVGGDFFDYLTVANGQTAIAVADAAGKGIRGAMNAVLTNGMLHEVARFKSDADVILSDLNAGLAPRMYGPSFIALNLAVLDESEKRVDYANGGQPYPILKRGSEIIEIENSDLPLGSMKRVQYESITFDLNEGDVLIFHTDGLIEALNADHDMYGTDRFKELMAQIPEECSAEEVIQRITEDVQDFVQEAEQYDDLTLVVIKRLSASN